MTNLCKEFDKFLSENDERFKELSKEKQFTINAIGYGVKYYDLSRRIDKAIEYIEEYKSNGYSQFYENEIEIELIDKLLDILKGSDKE